MKEKFSFRLKFDVFLLIIFLTISCVLLGFSGGSFIINFKSVGFGAVSAAERGVYAVSSFVTGTVSSIRELGALKKKYAVLTERLKDYELLQRSNADILRENKELKKLLKFSQEITTKNIPAEIIGFDPDNLYSGIIINRGTKQGIRKNMPVVAFQGSNSGVVGKIVQAGRTTSMIMPLYDYQCYVASFVQKTKDRGLVNGQGSPTLPLVMKYIQSGAQDDIAIGDKILASGEHNVFPKGTVIGSVVQIKQHDYESFLELLIDPVLNLSRLDYVFVLDVFTANQEAQ